MLTECPECKNQISDRARVCPQCGYPMHGTGDPVRDYQIRRMKGGRIFLLFSSAFCALWLIVGLAGLANTTKYNGMAFCDLMVSIICLAVVQLRLMNIDDRE